MIKKTVLFLGLLFTTAAAHAQQPTPTVAELRGALSSAFAQRDSAQNLHIQCAAQLANVADEIVKLRARVQELEKLSEKKQD